jgi:hypothetical protein
MESSTGAGNARDHMRISARTSIHVDTCSKLSEHGRRKHDDIQAFSVWCGTAYYSSGPLGPLRSTDPTSGRGHCGITARRAQDGRWDVTHQQAVSIKGASIFLSSLCGESLPRPQQQVGAPLPCSRLRLSSRGCHGGFSTRACAFARARGAEAGGCACRRAATAGYHRAGGALP